MLHLGSDHYGFQTKKWISQRLDDKHIAYTTYGSVSEDDFIDIVEFIPTVCNQVRSSPEDVGVLICGTGIGVNIGANKFTGIRSVLASSPKIAERGKIYDNTNVLCLSGWEINKELTSHILSSRLKASFEDPAGRRSSRLGEMDTWS